MFNFLKSKHQEMAEPLDVPGSEEDLYVLLDITTTDVTKTVPLKKLFLLDYIMEKYPEQPLQYFNQNTRLKVIHLKSGLIKTVKLRLDI